MLAGLFGPFPFCFPQAKPGHSAEQTFIIKTCHTSFITWHPLSHYSTSYHEIISPFCLYILVVYFLSVKTILCASYPTVLEKATGSRNLGNSK